MLFGTIKRLNIAVVLLLFAVAACKNKPTGENHFKVLYPQSGTTLKSGEDLIIYLNLNGELPDSIQYFIDEKLFVSQNDTAKVVVKTAEMSLGNHLVTAKIFTANQTEDFRTNIVLLSSKKPTFFGYKIINTYHHDISSYTQGLEFHDGIFYESDGEYGESSLRKVALDGKVLKQTDLDNRYFAEGITVVEDKILQLTYKEKVMFVYDKKSFELLKTIPYNHTEEGWGLAFDGHTIFNTDGSNKIFKLNKDSYQPESVIEVYDDKGPVMYLNELEWIDGKIYANIYTSDLIAVIHPETGEVESYIDLSGIYTEKIENPYEHVLNGIAWDKKGKRLFVTGKKWSKLFEIKPVAVALQ